MLLQCKHHKLYPKTIGRSAKTLADYILYSGETLIILVHFTTLYVYLGLCFQTLGTRLLIAYFLCSLGVQLYCRTNTVIHLSSKTRRDAPPSSASLSSRLGYVVPQMAEYNVCHP